MKYYFRLSDKAKREKALLDGCTPKPIKLYKETQRIIEDFQNNELSDWWPVQLAGKCNVIGDFATLKDAENEYYSIEGEDIYCIQHDC